jgi:DNA-directed RNA polymerase subunit RPC12/RpoP
MDSVRCPYCSYDGEFKLLKTWRYRWWEVYYYECPKCHNRFGFYVDPTGKRKSFSVKFAPRTRLKA